MRLLFNFKSTSACIVTLISAFTVGCSATLPTSADKEPKSYVKPGHALPAGSSQLDISESSKINTDLASAYLQSGQPKVALEVVKQALLANPQNATALAVQGLIYGDLNNFAAGKVSFQKALDLSPTDPNLNHNYGVFLCKNAKATESIHFFSIALNEPTYESPLSTHVAMGNCLVRIGKTTEARSAFKNALNIERFNATALFGLAKLEFVTKNYQEAMTIVEKLVATNGSSPQSLHLSIQIAEQMGNDMEKKKLPREIESKFPNSAEHQNANELFH